MSRKYIVDVKTIERVPVTVYANNEDEAVDKVDDVMSLWKVEDYEIVDIGEDVTTERVEGFLKKTFSINAIITFLCILVGINAWVLYEVII